eukprot:Partr_v1_DN28276_c0_g1_i2_m75984 putative SCY1-like 1 (S. cerevisiae)
MAFVSNFIKSSLSKAYGVATFPYSIGQPDESFDRNSMWTMHSGVKKDDSSPVSIFIFEVSKNRSMLPVAQNAVRKLKTVRLPNLLKYLDLLENDSNIYLVTEPVTPLASELYELKRKPDCLIWGLFTIASAVGMMNNTASLMHGNIRTSSVFVSQSGEWKLGGMELVSGVNDLESVIVSYGGSLPDANRYSPPEVRRSGWSVVKSNHVWAVDSWMYGCFLFECFNGVFSRPEQLNSAGDIPQAIFPHYQRLIINDPGSRPSVADLLQAGTSPNGFFNNDFIQTALFLENIAVREDTEKIRFFKNIAALTEMFPANFSKYKVLPVLMNALEFGSAGPKILSTILKLGAAHYSENEYVDKILPFIGRLFAIPDRNTRVSLLENLPSFADKLDKKTASETIFPQMVNGFNDAAPFMREATLKAVIQIVPQLGDRLVNNELLKHMAKLQGDNEPGIRANAVICLGKISKHLSPMTRQKVLITAFARSLRDPFPPSRTAAIQAFTATNEYYESNDIASKIIPCIATVLLDQDKGVRDMAFKSMDTFLKKLRTVADAMPDNTPPPIDPNSTSISSSAVVVQEQQQPSGDAWAGWAMNTLTKNLSSVVEATSGIIKSKDGSGHSRRGSVSSSGSPSTALPTQVQSLSYKPANQPSAPMIPQQQYQPPSQPMKHTITTADGWDDPWDDIDTKASDAVPKLAPPPPSNMQGISSFGTSSQQAQSYQQPNLSAFPTASLNAAMRMSSMSSKSDKMMADIGSSLNSMAFTTPQQSTYQSPPPKLAASSPPNPFDVALGNPWAAATQQRPQNQVQTSQSTNAFANNPPPPASGSNLWGIPDDAWSFDTFPSSGTGGNKPNGSKGGNSLI